MNSGKSTALLQVAYNYEERGQHVLVIKPRVDVRGNDTVVSRLGITRTVDVLLDSTDDVFEALEATGRMASTSAILVDEAQFLTPRQVDDFLRVAVMDGIPVLAYGIRTDFRTNAFPGARRLLEISHSLEELKTICRCGKKAVFNGRIVNGSFIFDGGQVAIDGVDSGYESLCARCYLRESGGKLGD